MEASMRSEQTTIRSPGKGHQAGLVLSTRRSLLGQAGFLFLLILLLAACGNSSSSQSPDANHLIKDAQAPIQRFTSYHFKLVTDNPDTAPNLPIYIPNADILSPHTLQQNPNH